MSELIELSESWSPEGAAEDDRNGVDKAKVGSICLECGKGKMEAVSIDAEERIVTRIGGFRMAKCRCCGDYKTTYPAQPEPELLPTKAELWQEAQDKKAKAKLVADIRYLLAIGQNSDEKIAKVLGCEVELVRKERG